MLVELFGGPFDKEEREMAMPAPSYFVIPLINPIPDLDAAEFVRARYERVAANVAVFVGTE